MKTFRYKVMIDKDVDVPKDSVYMVGIYLNDPHGWAKHGYTFEPVSSNEDVLIRISSPATIRKVCGLPGDLSCAELGGKHMYLNAYRWTQGAIHSNLPLSDYRQYMVSHEIGHILGHDHTKCPCKGCPAPIMMQQTKGIGKCTPNTKVFP
jgi:hypothetical protein